MLAQSDTVSIKLISFFFLWHSLYSRVVILHCRLKVIVTHSKCQRDLPLHYRLCSIHSQARSHNKRFCSRFMDNWLADLSISTPHTTEPKPARASGPLQIVSGNRQAYALDCHDGPENQRPLDLYQIDSQPDSSKYPSNTFTASAPLGSNDASTTINRTQQRQPQKHRTKAIPLNPKYRDRSYLTSKKYLDYRDRQRKDLGPDNKQVWSDAVEEAFQEGWLPHSQHRLSANMWKRSLRLNLWERPDGRSTKGLTEEMS